MFHIVPFIDELLFPSRCIVCKHDGPLLCSTCKMTFPLAPLLCPFCNAVTDSKTCASCKRKHVLQSVLSLYDYEHKGVQILITHMKYKGLFGVLQNLKQDIAEVISTRLNDAQQSTALIPVPSRTASFLERGFNQAEKIASTISETTKLPMVDCLRFASEARPQHLRSQQDRWKQIDNRVRVRYLAKEFKHAIVVDDLLTTGATLESCARALKKVGFETINGFTLARQKKMFH